MSGPRRWPSLERLIAWHFTGGTWLASTIITIGIVTALCEQAAFPARTTLWGTHIVQAGVAIIVALPIMRIALMSTMFVRARDYTFAAISGLVMAMIAMGVWVGLSMTGLH